jgi:hypothetical protein
VKRDLFVFFSPDNGLGDKGAELIGQALEVNQTLQQLDLLSPAKKQPTFCRNSAVSTKKPGKI